MFDIISLIGTSATLIGTMIAYRNYRRDTKLPRPPFKSICSDFVGVIMHKNAPNLPSCRGRRLTVTGITGITVTGATTPK